MTSSNTTMRFNEIGKQYKHWILRYVSRNFNSPIYFIWHLDYNGGGDKILLNSNKEVIASLSPESLIKQVSHTAVLTHFDMYTSEWIQKIKSTKLEVSTTFHIEDLLEALRNNLVSVETLKATVKFLNLFGDFADQTDDKVLQELAETESIEQLWDFYYDELLTKEEVDLKSISFENLPNFCQLYIDVQELVLCFESRISLSLES